MAGKRRRRLSRVPAEPSTSIVHLPAPTLSPLLIVVRRLLIALVVLVTVALVVYADRDGYVDESGSPPGLLDAFYYATVTLSTTGYGDIVPVSDGARLVNILVITPLRVLFLIILVGTTLEVLTQRTRDHIRQNRWRNALQAHTIVVGYGTKGRSAVAALVDEGVPRGQIVVVDESDRHIAEATADGLAGVQGDGTRAVVLAKADVVRAARVVVALPRDDSAVLTVLTVKAANQLAHVVAAVREAENAPLLRSSGADQVVIGSEAAGRLLGVGASSPSTGTVLADLLEPGVGLEMTTRSLSRDEIGRGQDAVPGRVLAVVRDEHVLPYNHVDAEVLQDGDKIVVVRHAGTGTIR